MAQIGRVNKLKIVRFVDFGLYLDGGSLGDILMPKRYMPSGAKKNDLLEVFIHLDSQDRLVATNDKPKVEMGQVAFLKVRDVNSTGAFLDWGMPKDLLAPFAEQRIPMEEGRSYCVFVYIDLSGRLAASSKLSLFLEEENNEQFKEKQEVKLLVASRSDMGYTTVINGTHLGLVHNAEILQPLRTGQKMTGYIKSIRADGKINLTLQKLGSAGRVELEDKVLTFLVENKGFSELGDKSSPEDIFRQYRVSKASYKKALSKLYKKRKIIFEKDGVKLV